jgi:hypothetical protein
MQNANTADITAAITRSRQQDEIVTVEVLDMDAAVAEVERIAADEGEDCDMAHTTVGDGRTAVEAWGWTADSGEEMTWRITLVAVEIGGGAPVAYTRDAAVARLAELGLDEEYADIECLSRAEHYEWLCTADADEIVSHREQMLRDAEGGAA